MNKSVIVSLGEVLWDLFPEGPRFGGAPANFACHGAALGANMSLISAVGNDLRGREAVDILQGYGIDVTGIQLIPDAPTGAVGVSLDPKGKPTFTIHEGAAWDRIAWMPELETQITAADAVYFGTLGQRCGVSRSTIRRALQIAKASGIARILDINLRPPFYDAPMIRESIQCASILKLSDDELPEVLGACEMDTVSEPEGNLRNLLERFALDLLVMTRGPEGALLLSPNEMVDQPGILTQVRDTVGAGDAFTAALVTGLLRGDSLETIARTACEYAAAVCSQPGAVPKLPGISDHDDPN